ncbi:MAG: hypothetical protein PXY39_07265 [archaeon]|nr:hypothetical protein [archaeon]
MPILLMWHVASVMTWLGSSAAFVFAIYPSLRFAPQDQKIPFYRSFLPTFSKIIGGASISTVLAGTFLFGYVSSIDTSRMPTGWNLIFISIGAVIGLVGIILTLGVILPLATKFMKQSLQDSNVSRENSLVKLQDVKEEVEATVRAINSVTSSMVVMLLIVVTLMTLGIYF